MLAACGGCWQEIRYEPPAQVVGGAAADHEADAGKSSEPPAVAASETANTPDAVPSAGDLFGETSVPPPIETATAPIETAPVDPNPSVTLPIDAAPIETAPSDAAVTDVTPVTPTGPKPAATPAERRDAWTAASEWSLAAAVYAKGQEPERYQTFLDEATRAAAALGLALPPLPTADEPASLERTVVAAMAGDVGAKFVSAIRERVDPAAGAAAQLAIQSHLLLLTYSPSSGQVIPAAAAIRTAGQRSGLPADLWQPLVEALSRRADFLTIRKAVFALRQAVAKHLAE